VELKFFGQFTFDEIAEQTGISANTAKSRLHGALEKLKTLMEVDYA
jgi:RNA polymerase sigma-70 factor (ECF subfamily)